jgi:hypothetical protein
MGTRILEKPAAHIILNMGKEPSSETLVFMYQITRRHVPENSNTDRSEILKISYRLFFNLPTKNIADSFQIQNMQLSKLKSVTLREGQKLKESERRGLRRISVIKIRAVIRVMIKSKIR